MSSFIWWSLARDADVPTCHKWSQDMWEPMIFDIQADNYLHDITDNKWLIL